MQKNFAWARLDGLPCDPATLAATTLTAQEYSFWSQMRAVEKRRNEWLLGRFAAKQAVQALLENAVPPLRPNDIEIVPDPHGRPTVMLHRSAPPLPSISIAHSHGVAIALAVRRSRARVGIDIEKVSARSLDFETIAFSCDERELLKGMPPEQGREWALRMWCAKEAVGKALGKGLSAGLLAFHIVQVDFAGGQVAVQLRDAALRHFPQFSGESFHVYTSREFDFVFSAIIYEQGAVRMRPSRQEILEYLLHKMEDLTQDWDYNDPVRPESKLFTELGFESLDAVVLCTAIQEHYQTPMPFAELLAEIGQQQRDLSINELADFVDTHLSSAVSADATRRVQ